MSENTQPESAAKVEEIALREEIENHPRLGEVFRHLRDGETCYAAGVIMDIIRPYIPSQPNHAERMLELLAKRVGYSNQDEGLINFIVNKLAAPVTPVSGNGPGPPQISNNGACSCCGTKLVRQELTLPHYVDWCSNCQTWIGAQPTPKVKEK